MNRAAAYIIASILLLPSFQAMAEPTLQNDDADLASSASSTIYNLANLPSNEQAYSLTQYSFGKINSRTDNYRGAYFSSNHTTSNGLAQTFVYGVTDSISLRMGEDYAWNKANSRFTTARTVDSTSNGFTDPAFGATWRVMHQGNYPFNVDLIGSYSPDLINARTSSPIQNGTVARGGQIETVGSAISYVVNDYTLYGSGLATYLDRRDLVNQTNDITINYNSSWQYGLSLNAQKLLNNLFSVNAGVSEVLNSNANASYPIGKTLVDYIYKPGNYTILNTALNMQVIPNAAVVSLIYSHSIYNNSTTNYVSFPHSDTMTKDESGNTVSALLKVKFN